VEFGEKVGGANGEPKNALDGKRKGRTGWFSLAPKTLELPWLTSGP
jgi:hypothetical protein